jgi:hypothetical protein
VIPALAACEIPIPAAAIRLCVDIRQPLSIDLDHDICRRARRTVLAISQDIAVKRAIIAARPQRRAARRESRLHRPHIAPHHYTACDANQ